MEREDRMQQIHKYVENMKEIRMLSTPNLGEIDYADVIMGHHLWYDCSRGYPASFDTFKTGEEI